MKTKAYQPKTGRKCSCKLGQARDNCPQCEGTGQVIDFTAIRAVPLQPTLSEYDKQAGDFLAKHQIKFRATLSDSKTPGWKEEGEKSGHHFRVTLSRPAKIAKQTEDVYPACHRITFDFWSSIADAEKGIVTVTPYTVLACISVDTNTPPTFKDFCGEYGYEEDSIKALQMFRNCGRFARRLRSFFTVAEIEDLCQIQ